MGALQRGHGLAPALFDKSDTNAPVAQRGASLQVAAVRTLYDPNFCAMELEAQLEPL